VWPPSKFLASLTYHDHQELDWSEEYDPPLEVLVQDLMHQIAQLIALTYNINTGKEDTKAKISDYLPTYGEQFETTPDVEPNRVDEVQQALAAKDELRAAMNVPPPGARVMTGPALVPNPNIRPTPMSIWQALTGDLDPTGGESPTG